MNRWLLLKDVLLTGTGLGVILSQIFSPHPNGLLLGTGLALTVPTIAEHVKALLKLWRWGILAVVAVGWASAIASWIGGH